MLPLETADAPAGVGLFDAPAGACLLMLPLEITDAPAGVYRKMPALC